MSGVDEMGWDEYRQAARDILDAAGLPDVEANEPVGEVEPVSDEEVPPEPAFLIDPTGYGKGQRPRITLPDGTPLGLWLDQPERRDLLGNDVRALLLGMGLDKPTANWYGNTRDKALLAREAVMQQPAMQGLARREREAEERTARVRAAFLKAQQKK